jgi:hypothetical protein
MTTLSVSDEAEMRAAFDLVTIKDVDGACLVRKTLVTLDDLNVDASVLREVLLKALDEMEAGKLQWEPEHGRYSVQPLAQGGGGKADPSPSGSDDEPVELEDVPSKEQSNRLLDAAPFAVQEVDEEDEDRDSAEESSDDNLSDEELTISKYGKNLAHDEDVALSFENFLERFRALLEPAQTEDETKRVFALFDTDERNSVAAENLERLSADLQIQVSPSEIRDMIAYADTNNDGEVTFDDFYQVKA